MANWVTLASFIESHLKQKNLCMLERPQESG